MKRFLLLVALTLSGLVGAFALEVKEGRIKLVLHEDIGRFSVLYMTDIGKDKYDPLFFSQDPRTSFLAVMLDDRASKLGEATSFRISSERTDGGAKFIFRSSILTITEEFSFIKSPAAALADGVRVDLTLTNQGERDIKCGLRLVLDTFLGEKNSAPFSTDTRSIASETHITASDSDTRWISASDKYGIMGSLRLSGIKPPDEVVFANWKRLNDSSWRIDNSPGRNFNLLPYSIGDSAVAYYFDPASLARGASRTETLALGVSVPEGFSLTGAETSDAVSAMLKASVNAAATPSLALRTDLVTIRDLLAKIDEAIKGGGEISDAELAAFDAILKRLEERKQGY